MKLSLIKKIDFIRLLKTRMAQVPADGLATALQGSMIQTRRPLEQPTASSEAKKGLQAMHDTPRCCLYFKMTGLAEPEPTLATTTWTLSSPAATAIFAT